MANYESGDAERDHLHGRKPEIRAARREEGHPRGGTVDPPDDAVPSDDPEVASEPMTAENTLSRLDSPDAKRVPPGKQLSGEPPSV